MPVYGCRLVAVLQRWHAERRHRHRRVGSKACSITQLRLVERWCSAVLQETRECLGVHHGCEEVGCGGFEPALPVLLVLEVLKSIRIEDGHIVPKVEDALLWRLHLSAAGDGAFDVLICGEEGRRECRS